MIKKFESDSRRQIALAGFVQGFLDKVLTSGASPSSGDSESREKMLLLSGHNRFANLLDEFKRSIE